MNVCSKLVSIPEALNTCDMVMIKFTDFLFVFTSSMHLFVTSLEFKALTEVHIEFIMKTQFL